MSKIIINPTGFGWKKGFGTHCSFCLSIEQHFIHVNGDLKEHMHVVILVFRRQIYWYWLNLNLILYLNIQFNVIEKKLMQSHEETFVWFPNRKSEYSEMRSQRRNNELSKKKMNKWMHLQPQSKTSVQYAYDTQYLGVACASFFLVLLPTRKQLHYCQRWVY